MESECIFRDACGRGSEHNRGRDQHSQCVISSFYALYNFFLLIETRRGGTGCRGIDLFEGQCPRFVSFVFFSALLCSFIIFSAYDNGQSYTWTSIYVISLIISCNRWSGWFHLRTYVVRNFIKYTFAASIVSIQYIK